MNKLNNLIIIILILITIQIEFEERYQEGDPSEKKCTDKNTDYEEMIENNPAEYDPFLRCCYQIITFRDNEQEKCCILMKKQSAFIRNYIQKKKKTSYRIKTISVKCSENYLKKVCFLIYLIILLF